MMLAGCAHALNPAASYGTTLLTALILAGPGAGWTAWKYAQLTQARTASPG